MKKRYYSLILLAIPAVLIATYPALTKVISEKHPTEVSDTPRSDDKPPLPSHHRMMPPSPEVFAQELGLTKEQQAAGEAIRQKSSDEMKSIRLQMKALRERAHEILEKNRMEFESLLTDEQREKLKRMHDEMKKGLTEFNGEGRHPGMRPQGKDRPEGMRGPGKNHGRHRKMPPKDIPMPLPEDDLPPVPENIIPEDMPEKA